MILLAVVDRSAQARRDLGLDAGLEHPLRALGDPPVELRLRHVDPTSSVGCRQAPREQSLPCGTSEPSAPRQARARARLDDGRSGGFARPPPRPPRRAGRVREPLRLVIEPLPSFARARCRRGGKLELGEGGPEVQTCPADDERRPAGGEDLVDRSVRQRRVLPPTPRETAARSPLDVPGRTTGS